MPIDETLETRIQHEILVDEFRRNVYIPTYLPTCTFTYKCNLSAFLSAFAHEDETRFVQRYICGWDWRMSKACLFSNRDRLSQAPWPDASQTSRGLCCQDGHGICPGGFVFFRRKFDREYVTSACSVHGS